MKGLRLNVFFKQSAIRASNNLSLILESCQHLLIWRDAMGFLGWVHSLNPPPCLCVSPKCSSVAVLRFCSHCAEAPAWMWHWEGTPEPHNGTAMSSKSNSGCKRASSAFLQLVWLLRHKPWKIPVHNKHQRMERMVAAESQNCHSLPGNFPSRDDITRNECMVKALIPINGITKGQWMCSLLPIS